MSINDCYLSFIPNRVLWKLKKEISEITETDIRKALNDVDWDSVHTPVPLLFDRNGRLIKHSFYLSDKVIEWILANIQNLQLSGIEKLKLKVYESAIGGFYFTSEVYDDSSPVFACKNCNEFLPIKNMPKEEIEYYEYQVDSGECMMPKWKEPNNCPFCNTELELITRNPQFVEITFDPTREIIDLQEIDGTIQGACERVPVLYKNEPFWLFTFEVSPLDNFLARSMHLYLESKNGEMILIGPIKLCFKLDVNSRLYGYKND